MHTSLRWLIFSDDNGDHMLSTLYIESHNWYSHFSNGVLNEVRDKLEENVIYFIQFYYFNLPVKLAFELRMCSLVWLIEFDRWKTNL